MDKVCNRTKELTDEEKIFQYDLIKERNKVLQKKYQEMKEALAEIWQATEIFQNIVWCNARIGDLEKIFRDGEQIETEEMKEKMKEINERYPLCED